MLCECVWVLCAISRKTTTVSKVTKFSFLLFFFFLQSFRAFFMVFQMGFACIMIL